MATQVERTASARKRLIAATMTLVGEQGVGGTSVAAIGEAAGMSRGAVNFHFGSKDDLLTAVAKEVTSDWALSIFERDISPDTPVGDTLTAALDLHRANILERPETFRIFAMLFFESIGPSPHLQEHFVVLHRRVRGHLAEQIAQFQQLGKINPDVEPDGLASVMIGAFRGITFQFLLDPDVDLKAALDEIRESLIARLAL